MYVYVYISVCMYMYVYVFSKRTHSLHRFDVLNLMSLGMTFYSKRTHSPVREHIL